MDESNSSERKTNKIETDPVMIVEIARMEYEHCVKRMDRLDNKVYIILTVCAFVFIMLTGIISDMGSIKIPDSIPETIILTLYLIFVAIVVAYVIMLLKV